MKNIPLLVASLAMLMVSAANATVFSITGALQESWSQSDFGSVTKTFSILPVISGTYDDELNQLNIAWDYYALRATVSMFGSADITYDGRLRTTYGAGARMVESKGLVRCIGGLTVCSNIPRVPARLESIAWDSSAQVGSFVLSEDVGGVGKLFESYTFSAQTVFYDSVSLYVADVPVPAAGWMLGTALMSLAGIRRGARRS